MKKVAGTLKIDMAQYRELEAFSKFSSDMDKVTEMTLDRGRKNTQLLIQPQYSPMPVGEQIAILYCGVHGLLRDVPVVRFASVRISSLRACVQPMLMYLTTLQQVICQTIQSKSLKKSLQILTDNINKRYREWHL